MSASPCLSCSQYLNLKWLFRACVPSERAAKKSAWFPDRVLGSQRSGVACLSVRSCGTNAPGPRGSAGREGCRSLPSHPRQYRRSPVYTLQELGWCDFFAQQVGDESDFLPARVAEENREFYRILCEPGEFLAEL